MEDFGIKAHIQYGLIGILGSFLILYLFYDHLIISLIGSFTGILFIKFVKLYKYNAWRKDIKVQFKEGLYTLSSSIQVGRSIENAFEIAINDLGQLYEEDTFIIVHFKKIVSKLSMNVPIEKALLEFAVEADDEDVYNFAIILISTKRSGGNIIEIIKSSSQVIHDKLDILEGIQVLITQKKYEQHIMMLILPIIMLYLRLNAKDMMQVMYTTLVGRIVMTLSLGLYLFSYYIAYKIISIEV